MQNSNGDEDARNKHNVRTERETGMETGEDRLPQGEGLEKSGHKQIKGDREGVKIMMIMLSHENS